MIQLLPAEIDFESRQQADLLGTPTVEFHTLTGACRALRGGNGVVHAWGRRALLAAVIMGSSRIVYSCGPEPKWTPLQDMLIRRGATTVVCPTNTLRELHIAHGIPSPRIRVIRPPVVSDASLTRADLGFAKSDIVILAAGESTWAANHAAAVWCVSILERLDPRYRLLLWGRGPLAERAAAFGAQFGQRDMVVVAEQRLGRQVDFCSLIPLSDLMLNTPRASAATAPVVQALSTGLPIVSTRDPTATELLQDGVNALLAEAATPKLLAQRVMDLRQSPPLKKTPLPSLDDFLAAYRLLYA
ncbi:MAG TPA: glycosyltransferase [Tepidisphaeraceae bacterium]|nr:glycosyltransferase [Tepidisphaeraceae bacterium]